MNRATKSVAPPGANGTMIFTRSIGIAPCAAGLGARSESRKNNRDGQKQAKQRIHLISSTAKSGHAFFMLLCAPSSHASTVRSHVAPKLDRARNAAFRTLPVLVRGSSVTDSK